MQEVIYNFYNMVYEQFIKPIQLAIESLISSEGYLLQNWFDIFFNWLFNIGRETPIVYFTDGDAFSFFLDLLMYICLIISTLLVYKVIKAIFNPIFKLLNIGGDIKWRR